MKNTAQVIEVVSNVEVVPVNPMQKSYTLVSTKSLDYNDLSAFEATVMSVALVLAVIAGTLMSIA